MTLSLFNVNPLALFGGLVSSDLELYYGSMTLTSHDNSIFVEYPTSSTGADVHLQDFVIGETKHELHAWQVMSESSISKWNRSSERSSSGLRAAMDHDVIIVAVPVGVEIPTVPPTSGPPAPGTTQKTVKIKIAQQGSLPWP